MDQKPVSSPSLLLKRFLFTMAEIDQQKRPWSAATLIFTWIVLTLFHDACAMHSFQTIANAWKGKDSWMIPWVMTLVETTMLLSIISIGKYGSYLESISIAFFAHLFGTFLVNQWSQIHEPQHGLIGGLTEPIICLLLLNICKSYCVNTSRTFSVVLITLGFVFVSLNTQTILNTDRSFIIRLLCGVFYILRNITVSYWHEEGLQIDRRNGRTLASCGAVLLCVLAASLTFLPFSLICPLGFALFTCCIHVYVTYITCAVLLVKVSVPTLCLLTAGIQCVESQILVLSSSRPGVTAVAMSCVFIIVGVYLYTVDAVETGHTFLTKSPVSTNEMLTRIQFVMFLSCTLGVLFYVLQPRVSSRDLNTLRYLGLDNVVRRLLSLEQKEEHVH